MERWILDRSGCHLISVLAWLSSLVAYHILHTFPFPINPIPTARARTRTNSAPAEDVQSFSSVTFVSLPLTYISINLEPSPSSLLESCDLPSSFFLPSVLSCLGSYYLANSAYHFSLWRLTHAPTTCPHLHLEPVLFPFALTRSSPLAQFFNHGTIEVSSHTPDHTPSQPRFYRVPDLLLPRLRRLPANPSCCFTH